MTTSEKRCQSTCNIGIYYKYVEAFSIQNIGSGNMIFDVIQKWTFVLSNINMHHQPGDITPAYSLLRAGNIIIITKQPGSIHHNPTSPYNVLM
jgi:hypothetical protein